jgi:hypothetical protein
MRITYLNYMYDLYGVSIGSTIKTIESKFTGGRENRIRSNINVETLINL